MKEKDKTRKEKKNEKDKNKLQYRTQHNEGQTKLMNQNTDAAKAEIFWLLFSRLNQALKTLPIMQLHNIFCYNLPAL